MKLRVRTVPAARATEVNVEGVVDSLVAKG